MNAIRYIGAKEIGNGISVTAFQVIVQPTAQVVIALLPRIQFDDLYQNIHNLVHSFCRGMLKRAVAGIASRPEIGAWKSHKA